MRTRIARGFLALYRLASRVWGKAFSLAGGPAFSSFGAGTVLQPPVRLSGERRIAIGAGVYIGSGCWLQGLGDGPGPSLSIGDGSKIVGGSVFSAVASVRIGQKVLIARNAYISDHRHAFADPDRAVLDQGIEGVAPVEICDGAWLGENVVVGPGVRIGRGAVIGANAVVLADVPDRSIAVGAPARVVRRIESSS